VGLPGYPGGTDVVGNWVRQQFQLDSLGEILHLLSAAGRHDRLDADGVKASAIVIDMIERRWNEPDAGTWELDQNWWTHSRLACVAGLRAFAGVCPRNEKPRLAELADTILAETTRRCLHPHGFWRRSPEHSGTDALLLLPPVRGAVVPDDPRALATIAAVEGQLTQDGYVYRFAPDDRPLGTAEGAFLLCGFTTSMAMWQQGRTAEAFRWFERTRASCGPPGLLSEEYDVGQRQLRGNLPQAFVHAALLESAQRLAHPYDATQT
jgi:GH15 family glucan-1,4-alpha-glucosidase